MKKCRAQVRHDRQSWADTMAEKEEKCKSNQLQDTFSNFRKLRPTQNILSPIPSADDCLISHKQGNLLGIGNTSTKFHSRLKK